MQGNREKFVLLTFDVEEFDMPLNYSQPIETGEQFEIGFKGLQEVMHVISYHHAITATFFTTAAFGMKYPETIRQIAAKHEIASHTCSNSVFSEGDLLASKNILEDIIQEKVVGLRMPQMQAVDINKVRESGYHYDSSINPIWLPGRYNNFHRSRTFFKENGVVRVPAAVWGNLRIPLFWLTFKNFPYPLFRRMAIDVMNRDGYVCLYFHPWEFIDLSAYRIPWYTRRLSKEILLERLDRLITDLASEGDFISMRTFCEVVESAL
jgi:peptidoglycan/xylan/chitin deacetylase (PgdA/CDA1 family)